MTPTLLGRWQTRLAILFTVGLLITLVLGYWFDGYLFGASETVLWVLVYVAVFGLAWDALYTFMQRWRWDSDWPPAYQFLSGVVEAAFIFALIRLGALPGVPEDVPLWMFMVHYWTVWTALFIMTQSWMRVLFPFWRFRGGQFGRHPVTREGA